MRFDPQSNIIVADPSLAASSSPKARRGFGGLLAVALSLAVVGGGIWAWTTYGGPVAIVAASPPPLDRTPIGAIRAAGLEETAPIEAVAVPDDDLVRLAAITRSAEHHHLMREADRLLALGRHREAIPVLEEAVGLSPENADARYKLGLACARLRNASGVERQRLALRELDPNLSNLSGNFVR